MKALRSLGSALLAPLLLAVSVALVASIVLTVWASWSPDADIVLSDYDSDANADVTSNFSVPQGDVFFDSIVTFTPPDWGVATDDDVPDGTQVGELTTVVGLGLLNNPCSQVLPVSFDLLDCIADPGTEFPELGDIGDGSWNGFDPVCPGGLDRACCQWPSFLSEMFPGVTPRARYYGHNPSVAGSHVVLNFLVLEPGTDLPDHPSFDEGWGYGSLTVLSDPTQPSAPSPITDNCSPVNSDNTIFGEADGIAVRANPHFGETYLFRSWSRGARDNDGDGIENPLDICPCVPNHDGDPRIPGIPNPDADGIDSVCDPDPASPCGPGTEDDSGTTDCDADGYANRGDNCPFVANIDQLDDDDDGLGNACDPEPIVACGDPSRPVATEEIPIDIEGPPRSEAETPTPTATATGTVTATGTATATGTPTPADSATPTTVPGEGCAPVIPATYNGLVRLNGVPAASGHEIIASIGGTEWGSAIISGGRYAIDVPERLPASAPCFAGDTIAFFVDGAPCTPVVQQWSSGLHDLDLTCVTVATPTPPAPTTVPTGPTATVPATPAKPPVTGGGSFGGDDGLPLWAMVLGGCVALLTVGGLATFARRSLKR